MKKKSMLIGIYVLLILLYEMVLFGTELLVSLRKPSTAIFILVAFLLYLFIEWMCVKIWKKNTYWIPISLMVGAMLLGFALTYFELYVCWPSQAKYAMNCVIGMFVIWFIHIALRAIMYGISYVTLKKQNTPKDGES